MKHYVVLLQMVDVEKSNQYRPQHLEFLADQRRAGNIFANGRFMDGAGGMVVYRGDSLEQIESIVNQDPYIVHKARSYEIHEWEIVTDAVLPY